jgi:glutathione S-transferase
MKLVIGNKNYSSWSMRPWLAARFADIPFEEEVIWLRRADSGQKIRAHSPNAKVPVLIDGKIIVFESIAILEYLAEIAPALWPAERAARAHARSICAEMHAGFMALRRRCGMNIRRKPGAIAIDDIVQADVDRLVAMWTDCRARFGGGDDFLFGSFTNADAMFAPVASRLHVYAIKVPRLVGDYIQALMATPMWKEWERDARAEPAVMDEIEAIA